MKVLVLGVGAQGSAAAKRLDKEPNVSEIVCADFDEEAVSHIVNSITKGRGAHVDAHKIESIVAAAEGVDLILNGLPLECTQNVLDAALIVKANYQDYAGTTALAQLWLDSDAAKNAKDLPCFEDKATEEWYFSLSAMYEKRRPMYEAAADYAFTNDTSAEQCADSIIHTLFTCSGGEGPRQGL